MNNSNPKKIVEALSSEHIPEMRYKGDIEFKQWQKSAREKLTELLGLGYMQNCNPMFEITQTNEYEKYTETYFNFQSEAGYFVPCCILIPKERIGKIPVMICLQGHSTGMHISLGHPKYEGEKEYIETCPADFARIAVDHGYCAVTIEQRYMGECGGDSKGSGCLAHGREGTACATATLLYGRCAIGERVWDISRTIDVICDNFDMVDCDDISCTGNSGGGTSTFYAACIDERIKYAMPSCSVCTYLDSIVKQFHCTCNYIPSIARYFDMGDLAGLIAPRKLVVVAGDNDTIFPLVGVKKTMDIIKKLYIAAGTEQNAALFVGHGGHQYYPEAYDVMAKMR